MGAALARTLQPVSDLATAVSKKVSSLPGGYMAALLATVPVAWILSEVLPSPTAQFGKNQRSEKEQLGLVLRALAAGGLCSFMFVLPVGLDKNKQSTMMATVFCGFFVITTVKCLVFPDVNPDVPMNEQETSTRNLVTKFLNFSTPFGKILLPVSEVQPKHKDLVQSAANCLIALAKLLALPVLSTQAFRLASIESPSFVQKHVYSPLVWAAKILAGSWPFDLLEAFVPLFTFGSYECAPFNNNVLLASSVSDFWAHRYNRMVSLFLRRNVHHPLRLRGYSSTVSSVLTFGVSGLLHSYVAQFTFGRGAFSSLLFFLAHAGAIHIQHKYLSKTPQPANVALLLAVLIATFPLYPQLFLDAGRQWLDNETPPPAWTYKVMSRLVPSLVDIE